MSPEERKALIDRLDRSFDMMPRWSKIACKHAMQAPTHHPETGKQFMTFREVIEWASDETLEILRFDFEDNGDLLPEIPMQ